MRTFIEGISVISIFFGIGGMAGAIENETNFIIPLICLLAGFVVIMIAEKTNETKVHDCTTNNDSDFRLHFLH